MNLAGKARSNWPIAILSSLALHSRTTLRALRSRARARASILGQVGVVAIEDDAIMLYEAPLLTTEDH